MRYISYPLVRRSKPLAEHDDRVWLWLVLQGWLILWGLGVLAEPYFPSIFTRPFALVTIWPLSVWPHWVLGVLLLSGGLSIAASCWLTLTDGARLWGRTYGSTVVSMLLVSYIFGNFPYAVMQFVSVLVIVTLSYFYIPRGC